ncbi:MAG: ABC transporter permease [Candidatus Limiplasma sp.]|nr:ABC transporter permease [Candidatus Limiplasma sp.]
MTSMILKKLFSIIPLLLLVSIILFVLINLLPGDAAMSMVTEGASEDYLNKVRMEMGLDQPPLIRYFQWLGNVLRGDFGKSLISNQQVSVKLAQRLPVTLEITLAAMVVSILIAVPLGILSAIRRNSVFDMIGSFVSMLGIAMPPFWMGMLLVLVFSVNLGVLPASGFVPFAVDPLGNLRSILMPSVCIGVAFAATVMRQTRSALLEVLEQDYITTAYAKGLKGRFVIWKHALRNALIPVVTVITMQIGRLIGGAVVTETVFALPGVGREIVDAILARDYPVVMGMILVVAALVVVTNALVDVLYILIDPRISTQAKKS